MESPFPGFEIDSQNLSALGYRKLPNSVSRIMNVEYMQENLMIMNEYT